MNRARRVVIVLPIVLTVLIAAAIGGLVIVQGQRQKHQVAAAETIAQAYLSDVGTFRARVTKKVSSSSTKDAGALRKIVDRAISAPPKLEDVSGYGAEHSRAYAEAREVEASFLTPYRRLSRTLARADVALDFIAAARKLLKLRASDYVGLGLITSSAPVRGNLIPAVVTARDEFDAVRVPNGQAELAATVHGAAQYVIDQATLLANRIESRQSFSFTYNEQFGAAAAAVNDYGTKVKGDVTEAINAVKTS